MVRQPALFLLASALLCGGQAETPESSALPPGVTVEQNVRYDSHPQTVLDIYKPSGGSGKRCGVLAIHGGGWNSGTKERVVKTLVIPWLATGCIVANVEYRLATVAPAPAAVEDILKAAAWFKQNASRLSVDSDRIVAVGTSAGGHLALMAGMTPKSAKFGPTGNVAAVINFYGITDVEDQLGGENMRKYAVTWVKEGEGRMELARRVSPVSYVRKEVPPVLTIHGQVDETVPYEHAVRLTKELRDAGADAEMISVPNGKHGFPPEQMDALYKQIFEFLSRRKILRDGR